MKIGKKRRKKTIASCMLQRDGKEEGYHKASIKRQKEEYWYSDKTYLKVSKGGEGTG